MTLDVRRRLDPQMAEALARSDALSAEFGPVAPDDIALRRAAYAHERAFGTRCRSTLRQPKTWRWRRRA